MKVGDLVRRKDAFVNWQEDNPWMKDRELTGVVVETKPRSEQHRMGMVLVHWFSDGVKWWYGAHKLEVINEDR
tara:strand:+ start:80 stop:298 length:219 start_codon:yes stop_codon:yes gene_type:complete